MRSGLPIHRTSCLIAASFITIYSHQVYYNLERFSFLSFRWDRNSATKMIVHAGTDINNLTHIGTKEIPKSISAAIADKVRFCLSICVWLFLSFDFYAAVSILAFVLRKSKVKTVFGYDLGDVMEELEPLFRESQQIYFAKLDEVGIAVSSQKQI